MIKITVLMMMTDNGTDWKDDKDYLNDNERYYHDSYNGSGVGGVCRMTVRRRKIMELE